MEKIKVFDITGNKTIQSWEEKFDCIYDEDDNALFISKEEFISDQDPDIKDYHYRYAIDCSTLWERGKCTWYYVLRLVVCPQSLDKEYLSKVAECSGMEDSEVTIQDILAYGGGDVNFGCETTEGEEIDYNIVTNIANVFKTMNSLKGFYLDRNWNYCLIGWDVIKHCVMGEDMFKKMR
jgi:hypothetical protein